ncbi:hypothetical protein EV193_103643 [Herbihabitans rhizosphaerae]|uniref:Enoyl reductase (ER) domain-containing protein n=1 Tax=Herbihabitans rhizosphaerae TaxID=1872711 RepID=A0A4Q7KYE3_9PSEU|nr:NADP-dependent oxidoreductase [Herbihabitans rhizosphaerae]RZS41320.1 hypothetical protein EV193_103643 [Herbihabitans rhizosphaerae]
MNNREIELASRPDGIPSHDNFELVETSVPKPAEGQILVRNTWMSVDPYMRGRMNAGKSYIAPFEVGSTLDGSAVGEVVESRSARIPVGATVTHFQGWREYAVVDDGNPMLSVVSTDLAPAEAYLGPLGTTGLTAWAAFTQVTPVREGDVVFVSAAAGAVGSVAGQIARKYGASTVIGSAGGPAKTGKLVSDFRFDAAIDYKAGPVSDQLSAIAPDGIDLYLDNVGGDHLAAALESLRVGGRVVISGTISDYNGETPGPSNLLKIATKELEVRGVLVSSYLHMFPEYIEQAATWLADGTLRTEQTVFDGIENAVDAFLGVLRGVNVGKMLVRL